MLVFFLAYLFCFVLIFNSRFPLGRLRSSISSGKQVPVKSHCLSAETEKQPESEAPDYLPLVSCANMKNSVHFICLPSTQYIPSAPKFILQTPGVSRHLKAEELWKVKPHAMTNSVQKRNTATLKAKYICSIVILCSHLQVCSLPMSVMTPQVRLQLASGAFLLTEIYSDCVQIPLDRLKRASPYSLHRRSLSPALRCTSPSAPSLSTTAKPPGAPSGHHVTFSPSACSFVRPAIPPFHHTPDDTPLILESRLRRRYLSDQDPVTSPTDLPSSEEGSLELSISPFQNQNLGQADSGRGSETDIYEGSTPEQAYLQGSSQLAQEDLEGSTWATAVALAWLEHRCAGYFMEWELVAAKADSWLRCQKLPEGLDMAGLKGAARQLFLLLRHWDENIQLNMLCYNPNNMWDNYLRGNQANSDC